MKWWQEDKSIILFLEGETPQVKCTTEEERIYGVKFKKDPSIRTPYAFVRKQKFHDTKKPYYVVESFSSHVYMNMPTTFFQKKAAFDFAKAELERMNKELKKEDKK